MGKIGRRGKGRLEGDVNSVILAEQDEWPVMRLSQAIAHMEVPENWGEKEHAVLFAIIAWAYSEGDAEVVNPPGRYLARFTGCNDWREFDKALRNLAQGTVLANAGNLDRSVGRQVEAKLIDLAPEVGRFAFRFTEPLREAVLFPEQYMYLETRVLAKLGSKYALRLYPILAIVAGRSLEPDIWFEASVSRLARWLGYPVRGNLVFSRFRREALETAIRHIAAAAPRRLVLDASAKVEGVPVPGRGTRFEKVRFPLHVPHLRVVERDRIPKGREPKNARVPDIDPALADALEDDGPLDVDDLVRGFEDGD